MDVKEHLMEQAPLWAKVAHEANRAYCETLGDYSQKPWDQAESWQRESAVQGVLHALQGGDAQSQHEVWMGDKIRDGWVYGPVKDPEKKTHPCLVPYSQLPESQRRKDHLFLAVVRALSRSLADH